MLKKWEVMQCDNNKARNLACECGIGTRLALLALNRGISSAKELKEFLTLNPAFCNPFSIFDMQKAVDRIKKAIKSGEKIAVYGDYDCDGVTATATLWAYLKSCGADVIYYIPDRIKEGYGLNISAIEYLGNLGIRLIITVDNGINSAKEVEFAKTIGIDTVITDHHLPQEEIPLSAAVIDPHRTEDTSSCTFLAGVGVAFKLICALNGNENISELTEKYGAFVLLGTVGDVVPLKGENRTVCKYGYRVLNNCDLPGIAALKEVASLSKGTLNSANVPFSLVPRINAAGRMGDSKRAVELLLSENHEEARRLAWEINEDNKTRQSICEKIFAEASAITQSEKLNLRNIIVIKNEGWHAGVVGIVASKIAETYNRPCILLTLEDGLLHGSGRSVGDFNIFGAVSYAAEYTEKFGGHQLAVGVTLRAENFDAFYAKLLAYTAKEPIPVQKLNIDCVLAPNEVNLEFAQSLKALEPFGAENEQPVFAFCNAEISGIVPLKGGKYVKINVVCEDRHFSALCFNYGAENFPFFTGDRVDMAFSLEVGEFRGKKQISLFVKQLRPHGINEDMYFASLKSYYAFENAVDFEKELIFPNRNEFANIFAVIKNSNGVTEETLAMRNRVCAGKIKVILQTFLQLNLINFHNGKYKVNSSCKKVSLESAETMQKLLERGNGNG